jgi:hypothetical protein
MHVELHCTHCSCRFLTSENADSFDDYSERTLENEPWYALGDGNTFEDSIYTTLGDGVCCPACGVAVPVSEEQLGSMAMEMLAAF